MVVLVGVDTHHNHARGGGRADPQVQSGQLPGVAHLRRECLCGTRRVSRTGFHGDRVGGVHSGAGGPTNAIVRAGEAARFRLGDSASRSETSGAPGPTAFSTGACSTAESQLATRVFRLSTPSREVAGVVKLYAGGEKARVDRASVAFLVVVPCSTLTRL